MFDLVTAEELKERLRASGRRGIALDIDDTLSQTAQHWIEQLVEAHGRPNGMTNEQLRLHYHRRFLDVPAWGTEAVAATHRGLVHSNETQERLALIEGADEAVRAIDAVVPIVAYVTARPIVVYAGTRTWLSRHGFPDAPVVFRPDAVKLGKRSAWKAEVLMELHPEVAGIVDDHVDLAGQLARLGYPGSVYLYDNGHGAQDGADMSGCDSWNGILELVRRDFAPAG